MSEGSRAPRYRDYTPGSQAASRVKSKTPSKHTKAEVLLRRALWHRGARYRLHADWLPGKPDLIFRGPKVAVFVDGDFWHGRDWERQRDRLRRRKNASYWIAKIEYNQERDGRNNQKLADLGWHVLRFWETDVKAAPEEAAAEVLEALRR